MASEEEVWKWLQALNYFGLALIKNVPTKEGTIKDVAERFACCDMLDSVAKELCSRRIAYLRNTMYGPVWDVKSVPNPINVAYTSVELPPHQDLWFVSTNLALRTLPDCDWCCPSYYEAPPGLQLLHCLQFEMKKGGDNTFIDGFWVRAIAIRFGGSLTLQWLRPVRN